MIHIHNVCIYKELDVMSRTGFVYTEEYYRYDYGPHHPLRISRLKLARDLMEAYGLLRLDNCLYLKTRPATEKELLSFHRQSYIHALRLASKSSELIDLGRYNLGPGDNPAFPGLFEWSSLTAGATIQCAELLHERKAEIAFNIAGGLHHAHENAASGFCYVNDPVLGILYLLDKGYRVAYVDIDAHHGDGVQWAFYHDNRVLTISFHQHGRSLFPGSGFVNELGEEDGYGYSLNVPLLPHTDDEIFVEVFAALVPEAVDCFKPDILVTQLGVDSFHSDPLANLDLTTNGFLKAVGIIKSLNLPWLALGGGGYNTTNVARAWTLAWAAMNDIELNDHIPENILPALQAHGYLGRTLRDAPYASFGHAREKAHEEAMAAITFIKESILPIIARKP
jgi:acetoin utilization protein AcuC